MARWISAEEEPAIVPAPRPAETFPRCTIPGCTLTADHNEPCQGDGGKGVRPFLVPERIEETRKRAPFKRSSAKKSVSPATSTLTGFPDVVPVPGAEEMYAAWCARGAKSRRGKKTAMKYQYPSGWERSSGPKEWQPGQRGVAYGWNSKAFGPATEIPQSERWHALCSYDEKRGANPADNGYGPPAPILVSVPGGLTGPVSVPTGPDERDRAWRKKNAKLDGYLSHLEVAGRILRRYAIDADTQYLELPESPGSLTVGETLEWSAERIAANLEHLVVGCIGQEVAA